MSSAVSARLAGSPFAPWLFFVIAAVPVTVGVLGDAGDWSQDARGLATVLPLSVLITLQVFWINARYGAWMALFAALVMPQVGHFGEHVAQITQIHAMGVALPEARGAVGALDIEWVHFIWNAWVLIGVGVVLWHFRGNRWLWMSLVIAVWHSVEHTVIMLEFWRTGAPGDPGLLSKGGSIGGGLPLARPDLHFIYNLMMTVPLVAGLLSEVARRRDPDDDGGVRVEPLPSAAR